MNYVENRESSEFYPTPAPLVKKMLEKVDWNLVQTILEPSAGKGDILREIARIICYKNAREVDVDCIELDPNLRSILKYSFSEEAKRELREHKSAITESRGRFSKLEWESKKYKYFSDKDGKYHYFPDDEQEKLAGLDFEAEGFFNNGVHIVHDDFLTYKPYKQYNLIVMNPPFSNGVRHLLKALKMQKNGSSIVCLLNAETIRNPFTPERMHLVSLLKEYEAEIEYIKDGFTEAERRTDVEIALVRVDIPYSYDDKKSIFDKLAQSKNYKEPAPEETTELEVTDFIQAIINRYNVEVESGIEFIRTYKRMLPYLRSSVNPDDKYSYEKPVIALTDGSGHEMTVNGYVRPVRFKYWKGLLTNDKFTSKLTAKLQNEYRERVNSFADYDFSKFNIYTLLTEMNSQIKSGIENEIMAMYDRLTEEHAYYPECRKNRYLYNGWKTNKAWKLDKKSIIPCYGVFDAWDRKTRVYKEFVSGTSVISQTDSILVVLQYSDGTLELNAFTSEVVSNTRKSGVYRDKFYIAKEVFTDFAKSVNSSTAIDPFMTKDSGEFKAETTYLAKDFELYVVTTERDSAAHRSITYLNDTPYTTDDLKNGRLEFDYPAGEKVYLVYGYTPYLTTPGAVSVPWTGFVAEYDMKSQSVVSWYQSVTSPAPLYFSPDSFPAEQEYENVVVTGHGLMVSGSDYGTIVTNNGSLYIQSVTYTPDEFMTGNCYMSTINALYGYMTRIDELVKVRFNYTDGSYADYAVVGGTFIELTDEERTIIEPDNDVIQYIKDNADDSVKDIYDNPLYNAVDENGSLQISNELLNTPERDYDYSVR